MGVEYESLVGYARKTFFGLLTVNVEVLVVRLLLAQFHLLYVGYQQLYLIVGYLINLVKVCFGLLIAHCRHLHEGKVVERLSLACRIVARQLHGLVGINAHGV